MSNYAARHSIPPMIRQAHHDNVRLGLGLGVSISGLGLPVPQVNETPPAFRPAVAGPSPLAQVKRGISAEMQRLNEALTDLAAEVRDDEDDGPFLHEIELIKAHLQRLAEAL